MAADRRRKGLSGAAGDVSMRDKSRGKEEEKQVGSLDCKGFGVKPHVSLKWDAKRKRVISKREQIGLSWRHLRRFAEPSPRRPKILADTFDVPTGLFELENTEDVLSYEVWQNSLSEKERRFLAQFLPRGSEPRLAVKQLFAGENFHFGNPFVDWAASLKSGNLHPDAVVHREQSLKAENSTYYLELHRYHNDMIGSLLEKKGRCQSFSDLENEFNQNMLRSRKGKEKKFLYADRSEICDLDNSFAGTSKSSSFSAEEKTSNSDEQIQFFKKAGESRKRISKKRHIKDKSENPPIALDNVLAVEGKPTKGVKLKKRNIVYNDGTKYMSYVKISKRQHELAKSMEQSGSSMQTKSLGYLSHLQIQPYEVFVDEERKKLHDHWLHLANHDLPSAYGIWNDIRSQKQQMMRSLEQELLERHDSLMEDDDEETPGSQPPAQKGNEGMEERLAIDGDKESSPCSSQDRKDNGGADYASSMEYDEESTIPGFVNNQRGNDAVNHQFIARNHEESLPRSLQDARLAAGLMLDRPGIIMHDEDANSVPGSSQDPFLNQEPSTSSCNPNFNHVSPQSGVLELGSTSQEVSAYSGNLDGNDLIDIDRVPFSQGSEMWQPVSSVSSMPLTYFDSSSVGCQFNSAAETPLAPSLAHIDGEQQTAQWSDLRSDLHGQVQQLHRDSNSFISYPNDQDQNELLQSIFNGQQGMLHPDNINNQEKHLGPLNFQLPESILTDTYGQRMQNSIQQNMSTGSILPSSGGSRFLMQQRQQEHLLPISVSIQDWAHQAPSTMQPPSSLSGPNRFSNSNEHQVHGGRWTSCSSGPSQTNNLVVDQSVYGILPHCNHLSSRPPSYDSIEQAIPSQNYGHGLMNGPGIRNGFPRQTAPPLDYMNRRGDDMRWLSLPLRQNSSMNDSMGKPPFLGSWNP